MRKILALMAVFAMTASPALAFDHSTGPVGQVYFSIPFGAPTLEQAMPRLGFRFDHGQRQAFDDADGRIPYSLADWSLNLNGQSSLRLNGVDVGRLSRPLSAADDGDGWPSLEDMTPELVALGFILFGIIVVAEVGDPFGD